MKVNTHKLANPCPGILRSGISASRILCLSLLLAGLVQPASGQDGIISQALFTTAVIDGRPVNRVLVLDDTVETVYFYTRLKNFQGKRITHRWEYNGRVMAQQSFQITSANQAIASSVKIGRQQTGRWSVVIENQQGWPLHAEMFMYAGKAAAEHGVVIMPLSD